MSHCNWKIQNEGRQSGFPAHVTNSQREYHFLVHAMGAREVFQCSSYNDVEQVLSQGGFNLIIGDEGDVKRIDHRGSPKIESFEFIIQTLLLGCFPDEL
jgi:hypothetical protein